MSVDSDDDSNSELQPPQPKLVKYKSWIWRHGKLHYRELKGVQKACWNCNDCRHRHKYCSLVVASSTWIIRHLREEHQIFKARYAAPIFAELLDESMERVTVAELVSRPPSQRIRTGVDLIKFQRDMTTWISVSRQAFVVVEEPKFRDMIGDLSIEAEAMIPKSGNTVRKRVKEEFIRQREILIDVFKKSQSRVHLSLDIWTTPSGNRAYLGIVAHWVNEQSNIRETLIALPDIDGRHTGANIAETLFDVIKKYGIAEKVGYCQLDSASNNTTAIKELQPLLVNEFGEHTGIITASERRLRCFGHLLNLGARKLLFGEDADAFELDNPSPAQQQDIENKLRCWRKGNGVGKLFGLEVFIKRSPQRQADFCQCQIDYAHQFLKDFVTVNTILLSSPNATRWNSVFLLLNDTLNLRKVIDYYLREMTADESPLD